MITPADDLEAIAGVFRADIEEGDDDYAVQREDGYLHTPTLIAADGRILPGAVPAEKLDQWLNAGVATTANAAGAQK